MLERKYIEHADCFSVPEADALDMYNVVKDKLTNKERKFAEVASAGSFKNELQQAMLDSVKTLPFAAEHYKISPDIKDYIMQPFVIMTSALPNRNLVGFPHNELSSFCPDAGTMVYKTWRNKPTFEEHMNKDISKAKGIILDSLYKPMPNVKGNLWKVLCLAAFDRSKDSYLANEILSGRRKAASMGAYCSDYTCNICGSKHSKGGCEHIRLGKPKINIVDGRLAYLQAVNPLGFELSSVAKPAYWSCQTDKKITL